MGVLLSVYALQWSKQFYTKFLTADIDIFQQFHYFICN